MSRWIQNLIPIAIALISAVGAGYGFAMTMREDIVRMQVQFEQVQEDLAELDEFKKRGDRFTADQGHKLTEHVHRTEKALLKLQNMLERFTEKWERLDAHVNVLDSRLRDIEAGRKISLNGVTYEQLALTSLRDCPDGCVPPSPPVDECCSMPSVLTGDLWKDSKGSCELWDGRGVCKVLEEKPGGNDWMLYPTVKQALVGGQK